MILLDRLLNQSVNMTYSNSFFMRNIGSRASMVAAGIPLEILATLQNLIKLPWESAQMIVKIPATIIGSCTHSPSLDEFAASLTDRLIVLQTALKVIGYAIGIFFTTALGLLNPRANLFLHTIFRLATDEKAKAAIDKAKLEAEKKSYDQKTAMLSFLQNLILAQQFKMNEKERLLMEEKERRREIEESMKIKAEEDQRELAEKQTQLEAEKARLREKEEALRLEEEQKRMTAEKTVVQVTAEAAADKVMQEKASEFQSFWKKLGSKF